MTDLICLCEAVEHPHVLNNPPGLEHFLYRTGDFLTFRHALLQARDGEVELKAWHPSARADLGLQMLEWWAYLADILTFYNETLANEAYLGTAGLDEDVRRLIRVLGYRPRPGIGASGVLAALSGSRTAITLPAGFQAQSKPGPGKQPQIFELDSDTTVDPVDTVPADAPPATDLLEGASVLLKGSVSGIEHGEQLLLWSGETASSALAKVEKVEEKKDPRGRTNTKVTLDSVPSLPANPQARDYRLLRPYQSQGLWTYTAHPSAVIVGASCHLAALARQLQVGAPLLLDGLNSPVIAKATAVQELVWYANATNQDNPAELPKAIAPATDAPTPIPILHTAVSFTTEATANDFQKVSFDWRDVGQLVGAAQETLMLEPGDLPAAGGSRFPVVEQDVLIEDRTGAGVMVHGTVSDPAQVRVGDIPSPAPSLQAPLSVLFNLLTVSRGQSVQREVLGSGDASIPGQEFVLRKSPLTYLRDPDSAARGGYKSSLQVWVDDVEWTEVSSFYAQPPDARVFVTREDEAAKTHVTFGDGVNGARLSSGADNVVATYRFGSGKESPAAGSLSVILKPYPGLKSLRNPVAVAGGEDPDPGDKIRTLAPRSVLTFGRAISGDDYEVVAAQTPGVMRARAYWTWDAEQQRTLVKVYVGDDDNARNAADEALRKAIDPNRPVTVESAIPRAVHLDITVKVDPERIESVVKADVQDALLDPDRGLFGSASLRIGHRIYDSEIYRACLSVPGANAVHKLTFKVAGVTEPELWHDTGEGGFFQLADADLRVNTEVATSAV